MITSQLLYLRGSSYETLFVLSSSNKGRLILDLMRQRTFLASGVASVNTSSSSSGTICKCCLMLLASLASSINFLLFATFCVRVSLIVAIALLSSSSICSLDFRRNSIFALNLAIMIGLEGRQADIYHIDMDHAAKVLISVAVVIPSAVLETISAAAAIPTVTTKVIRDPEEESSAKTATETISKDKGKGILVEEPKPIKKKQQVELDKAYARKLQEEFNQDID
uniref:Uncharacterized protein n=1 Tax=Tanacetum cinerariifolium TaxID=118510 RepID=A0A699JG60_TANCI|nr:hypothetical protein [Tanacetum cinerariifolium]